MKTGLQKHTSKFVAGLFNSLGITACVSLTSCGGENKVKQTENQVENLKNGLMSKGLDDKDAQVIVDWLNSNGKDSNYELTAKDLQEIFKNNPDRLNEVAETLGVELTESDAEPDDEKKKEIQKWVTKLASLKDAEFDKLDEVLKEKVAQMFINDEIAVDNDDVINEKLAGFIKEVKDEKKQNEISITIEKGGKAVITKVADSTTTNFTFETFDVFKNFVNDLDGKEITNVEGELSFAFAKKNVKICGHENGFDVTGCFEKFLNCFEVLTKIEVLKLKVSDLSLKVENSKLTLNGVDCSGEYFKTVKFLTLVKDHAAFFGIAEEKNKFEIEKDDGEANAVVKIGGFKTELVWSEVVAEGGNAFVENSGWDKIFKIKNEEQTVKTDVTVEFKEGKCFCNEIEKYKAGVELNNLAALEGLVGDLKDKKVTIGNSKNFSLAFDGKNVKVCGHGTGFEVMKESDFENLLKCVAALKGVKAVDDKFKIQIAAEGDDIKFGDVKINQDFIKTQNFWNAVKPYKDLFDKLPIKVKAADSNQGKIGDTVIAVKMFESGSIVSGWNEVFEKE